jgi:hypothetical protein
MNVLVSALFLIHTAFAYPAGSRVTYFNMTMSDGVVLNTVLVLPKDYVPGVSKYPLVVDRSPYGYDNIEWITDIFTPFGLAAFMCC